MKHAVAFQLVNDTIKEVMPLLRSLSRHGRISPFHQTAAESLRDVLDNACRRFEDGDACEMFEQEYLCLFDCLALVNTALAHGPNEKAHLVEAVKRLDQLQWAGVSA